MASNHQEQTTHSRLAAFGCLCLGLWFIVYGLAFFDDGPHRLFGLNLNGRQWIVGTAIVLLGFHNLYLTQRIFRRINAVRKKPRLLADRAERS
jgi:hypothetical protein